MKKYFLIIIIIVSLNTCKKSDKSQKIIENSSLVTNNESIDKKSQLLKNDTLVAEWKKELCQFTKMDLNFKTELELFKSNNRSINDTLKTWLYRNSHFAFLKKNDQFLLSGGLIKDTLFSIYPKIRIGMSNIEFGEIFDVRIKTSIVDISDTENNAMFFFQFKNDTLNNISFELRTE